MMGGASAAENVSWTIATTEPNSVHILIGFLALGFYRGDGQLLLNLSLSLYQNLSLEPVCAGGGGRPYPPLAT